MTGFENRTTSWALAIFAASALCLVLATRIFVSFDGVRLKLVRTPVAANNGRVHVEVSPDLRAGRLVAPVAVIAVVRNPGAARESVSIIVDGAAVCDVQVAPRDTRRVDCVVGQSWVPRADHSIEVVGPARPWTLEFLELATHHGSTTHVLPFLILPDAGARFEQPGIGVLGFAWVLVCLVGVVPATTTWSRAGVWAHRFLSGGVLALVAAMVISPWLSPFVVVMPISGFVKVAVILLAPRLWRLGEVVSRRVQQTFRNRPGWLSMLTAAAVAGMVGLAYGAVVRNSAREFNGNYAGLLRVSEGGFDRSPLFDGRADVRDSLVLQPDEGYDAQFYYFTTFDPLIREFWSMPERYRSVVDAPPYRFGRIGFPWFVRLVAGDRWDRYPIVMVGLVLAGVTVSAFVVSRLAQGAGVSAMWGFVVLAIPGFWQSVRLALPEPLAAAFLLLGYWCVRQRRIALAAFAFACSLLIRETGLVFVVAVAFWVTVAGVGRRERIVLLSAAIPLLMWRIYLAVGLWPDWGWDGLLFPSQNLGLPFQGLIGLWFALWRGDYHPAVAALARAATWYPMLLIGVSALAWSLIRVSDRLISVAFAMYALMSLSFTHPSVWGHVGNAQRVSYELFVMLALASLGAVRYSRRQRAAIVAAWCGAAWFAFFLAHDASAIRDGLLPWN